MLVRVRLFAHFRELFGAKDKALSLSEGAVVRDALAALCDTPERQSQVFDGQLKRDIVILKNGAPIRALEGLDTPLSPEDVLAVFPLLGGG
jgi:molybdopterin converting factor small subunit